MLHHFSGGEAFMAHVFINSNKLTGRRQSGGLALGCESPVYIWCSLDINK
jgi:hypothetical protein